MVSSDFEIGRNSGNSLCSARWTPSSISFFFFYHFLSTFVPIFVSRYPPLEGWRERKRKRKRERHGGFALFSFARNRCIGKRGWYRSVVKHRSLAGNFGLVVVVSNQLTRRKRKISEFRSTYSHELFAIPTFLLKSLGYEGVSSNGIPKQQMQLFSSSLTDNCRAYWSGEGIREILGKKGFVEFFLSS